VAELLDLINDTLSTSLNEWTPVFLRFLDRVFGFICAACEGPCKGNQLELSSQVSRTLNRMLNGFNQLLSDKISVTLYQRRRVMQAKVGLYCALKALLDSNTL